MGLDKHGRNSTITSLFKVLDALNMEVWNNLSSYSQFTIDVVNTECLELKILYNNRDLGVSDVGALGYSINNILEIISPERVLDTEILKKVAHTLEEIELELNDFPQLDTTLSGQDVYTNAPSWAKYEEE